MMRGRTLKIELQATRRLDRQIENIFNDRCRGVQIPVLNIPKIFAAGRAAAAAGGDVEAAIVEAAQALRVN